MSAICFNLDRSKILSSGNGLKMSSGNQSNINLAWCQEMYFTKKNKSKVAQIQLHKQSSKYKNTC